jgi:hypothetical protein
MVVHYQTIDVDVVSPDDNTTATEVTSLLSLGTVPIKKGMIKISSSQHVNPTF